MNRLTCLATHARWPLPLRPLIALAFVLAAGTFLLIGAPTVRAHPAGSGYTVTVQLLNGPNFTYDTNPTPYFLVNVQPPSGSTPNPSLVALTVNGHEATQGTVVNGSTGSIGAYYETSWNWLGGGTQTVIAAYDQGGADAAQSAPLTETAQEAAGLVARAEECAPTQ